MTHTPSAPLAFPRLRTLRVGYAALALILLALPLVAMAFTGEVNWGPGDFVLAAGLLALLGMALEGALRLPATLTARAGAATLALAAFLLVWAELAVGVFD